MYDNTYILDNCHLLTREKIQLICGSVLLEWNQKWNILYAFHDHELQYITSES